MEVEEVRLSLRMHLLLLMLSPTEQDLSWSPSWPIWMRMVDRGSEDDDAWLRPQERRRIDSGRHPKSLAMASHGFGPMDGEMSELFTLGQQSLRRIGRLKIMNVLQIRLAIKTVLRVHLNWICIR